MAAFVKRTLQRASSLDRLADVYDGVRYADKEELRDNLVSLAEDLESESARLCTLIKEIRAGLPQ